MLILDIEHVVATEFCNNLVRYNLVTGSVLVEGFLGTFGLEIGIDTGLGHQVDGWVAVVGVVALDGHIVNLGTNAQCSVAWEGPGGSGPGENAQVVAELAVGRCLDGLEHLVAVVYYSKLGSNCLVLHVAVASRLVELV